MGVIQKVKAVLTPPPQKKKNYTKSRWRVTDPPVLPLKLKKSASCYGQLVPVGHKSMMKFYNPAKCEVGYRYGFILPLWMLIAEIYGNVMNKGESVQK